MMSADRRHPAQVRLDEATAALCDRICVRLTERLGRPVNRPEAVRMALANYAGALEREDATTRRPRRAAARKG